MLYKVGLGIFTFLFGEALHNNTRTSSKQSVYLNLQRCRLPFCSKSFINTHFPLSPFLSPSCSHLTHNDFNQQPLKILFLKSVHSCKRSRSHTTTNNGNMSICERGWICTNSHSFALTYVCMCGS